MKVIKLGGSLAQSNVLLHCLDTIEQSFKGCGGVIVPGGGGFADQVRVAQSVWHFDDKTAHDMALLAMQQMALLFNGLKKEFVIAASVKAIDELVAQQKMVIWSPAIDELERTDVAASWDVTSDSLAAWLAQTLSASELVLVKSADILPHLDLQALSECGIVDKAFVEFTANANFKINIINAQHFNGRT